MKNFHIKGVKTDIFLEVENEEEGKKIFPIIYEEEVLYICEVDEHLQDIKPTSLKKCPYCNSYVTQSYSKLYPEIGDNVLKDKKRCYKCDKTWTEYWELIKIEKNNETI